MDEAVDVAGKAIDTASRLAELDAPIAILISFLSIAVASLFTLYVRKTKEFNDLSKSVAASNDSNAEKYASALNSIADAVKMVTMQNERSEREIRSEIKSTADKVVNLERSVLSKLNQ